MNATVLRLGDILLENHTLQLVNTSINLAERPVVVVLSATALPEDREEIMELLSMQEVKILKMSLYRSNLPFMKRITPIKYLYANVLFPQLSNLYTSQFSLLVRHLLSLF